MVFEGRGLICDHSAMGSGERRLDIFPPICVDIRNVLLRPDSNPPALPHEENAAISALAGDVHQRGTLVCTHPGGLADARDARWAHVNR